MAKIKTDKKTDKVKLNKIKDEPIKKKIVKIVKKEKTKEKNIKLILQNRLKPKLIKKTKINVNVDKVKVAIEALFKLTKESVTKKLFDDEYPILLQVTCVKIPNCPDRIMRLPLEKTLLTESSEICLIVSDLKKGRRIDYNPTIEHYEDLLKEQNVTNIKRIIPMNAIKTEYDQYELKRRLVSQYDLFLADGRICGHLSHLLGKVFYNKRKIPTSIHLGNNDLKSCVEKAILKTQMHIHPKGNSYIVQIGHSKMSVDDITLNFSSVCANLAKYFPGGWKNIRSLHVKTHLSIAIPVYMSLKSANQVRAPKVVARRPKAVEVAIGELSTMKDTEIKVLPSGKVVVEKSGFKKQKK